jgi:hypothetical protein
MPLRPTSDGLLKSKALPGLWLDSEALIREDHKRLVEVAQQGIASTEHTKFVAQLKKKHFKKK